jgi:hypothetical protein
MSKKPTKKEKKKIAKTHKREEQLKASNKEIKPAPKKNK